MRKLRAEGRQVVVQHAINILIYELRIYFFQLRTVYSSFKHSGNVVEKIGLINRMRRIINNATNQADRDSNFIFRRPPYNSISVLTKVHLHQSARIPQMIFNRSYVEKTMIISFSKIFSCFS